LNLFGFLFGAPAQAAPLPPPAISAPAHMTAPARVVAPAPAREPCALDDAVAVLAAARDAGDSDRVALSRALRTLAFTDFEPLALNGPHTRAGDRVNRKALKKAQRVLLVLAETGERA